MITQIRPSQLAAWLDSMRAHGEPLVLDVREPSELRVASVTADGFTLRTIPMGVIPPRLNELNPAQPVACLCHHGARSMQVASFLKAQGFEHVANIAGGIHAWSAELDANIPVY
ncbi:rhodanese-like domain-containing protein [Rhodoferax sp. PAMC 29310]|uniref:rhodanese-like domain-containing protein n=1 Tax=Rhodoferax sp. PAMC 29310 TaxID=2822760 RepID=UPI001B337986|nr:rhodanese-like domain-containing protein [Rhodoferax sp. PAMC 29310]